MSDSSEDDFMSDAFLAKITADAAPKPSATTYQEKRRRAAAASQARAQANQLRPFREREHEARQAGLETNLIEKELRARDEGAEVGVGLKMMLKMGYAGGERLGRQPSGDVDAGDEDAAEPIASGSGAREAAPPAEDLEDADEFEGAHGGLGSRKRIKLDVPALATPPTAAVEPTRPNAGGHLLEPLSISIWAGRKGLGARAKVADAAPTPAPTTIAPLDTSAYRSRGSAEYAEKKAEGQLRSAQKTVLELDARDDKGFSILHLSPTDASTFPPPLIEALSFLPPVAQSFGAANDQTQAELLKAQMAADSLAPLAGGGFGEDEDEDVGGQTGLGGLQKGREAARQRAEDRSIPATSEAGAEAAAAAPDDGEDWNLLAAEARKLLVLPASQRLPLTLQYLRAEYRYCLFCGCAYENQQALDADCPGELEDDHD